MASNEDITREMPTRQEDFHRPQGTLEVAAIHGLQGMTVDTVKRQAAQELLGVAAPVRTSLVDRINDWGKKNIITPLKQIFSGLIPAGWEETAAAFHDGQTALHARTDLLSPLLDYGSVYMDRVEGWNIIGVMPFTNQIGPMRGVSLSGKGIRLDSEGLWDIRAQITAEKVVIVTGWVECRVVVKTPDGQLFSEQRSTDNSPQQITQVIVSSVVVPAPGYTVEVEVLQLGAGRAILGGAPWNRLTVQHISRTVAGHSGAGEAYVPPVAEGPVPPGVSN